MDAGSGFMLGLDMGASGVKCVAANPDTGQALSVYTEWQMRFPKPGRVELRCRDIWDTVLASIAGLAAKHGVGGDKIISIGACALCPGLIAMAADGTPLTDAITFMDGRSAREAAELNERLGVERIFAITGNRLMAGATSLSTIAWIRDRLPDVYDRTATFVHMPTWLGFLLTGRIGMDFANAAGTCLFDIRKGGWSEELMRDAGIDPAKLPRLGPGSELLGGLENPELLALGFRKGTPVAIGGGDTACTALALGAVTHGRAFVSLGTSAVITAASEKSDFDNRLSSRAHVFRDLWIEGGAMSCGGASLKWAGKVFCRDFTTDKGADGTIYDYIEKLASASAPGAGGLVFLPYLNGERNPVFDPNARGLLFGVGLASSREDCLRAVLEGVGFGLRQLTELLEGLLGVRLDDLPLVGGGARIRTWVQIIADILGRRLRVADFSDAGAVGAAMLGGMAAGMAVRDFRARELNETVCFAPDMEAHRLYQDNYEKYLRLYPAVRGLY